MDKFQQAFSKKANIAYIVGAHPSVEYFRKFIDNLDKSAIDILEIGIPYSDPIADGKTIFDASFSAVGRGVTTDTIFDTLQQCQTQKPIVLLVYYNLIFAYGEDAFLRRAKERKISGIIVPDLPYEENAELFKKCQNLDIALIPLISITSEYRMDKILSRASGFIYAIGAIGVTGSKGAPQIRLQNMIADIKKASNLPVAIGFGIRTNDDVKRVKNFADGAIVGTSIVKMCSEFGVNEIMAHIGELFRD